MVNRRVAGEVEWQLVTGTNDVSILIAHALLRMAADSADSSTRRAIHRSQSQDDGDAGSQPCLKIHLPMSLGDSAYMGRRGMCHKIDTLDGSSP
jgi:hypothetical protein